MRVGQKILIASLHEKRQTKNPPKQQQQQLLLPTTIVSVDVGVCVEVNVADISWLP
jgi:hypothetical protein